MLIEIRGIGFPNKGAELMLIAAMKELSKAYPDAQYVTDMDNHFLSRAKYGLFQKIWFARLGTLSGVISAFLPSRLKNRLGIKDSKDIDVIIDASGFRYTKQWGLRATKECMADHIEYWKNENKKIIFLPQAWGPFDDSFKESITKIVQHSDLLIARDATSKANIEELTGLSGIKHYPDFSNLLSPKDPSTYGISLPSQSVAIVPNCRMLDKMSADDSQMYPHILKHFISDLVLKGYHPFFLMHEGDGDKKIAVEVNAMLDNEIDVVGHEDPLVLKGIISKCDFIIGSRFHALVSALSLGVPVISMGWSHKYNLLMSDYGLNKYLVKSGVTLDECSELLASMLTELELLKSSVSAYATVEKDKSRAMWKDVISAIDK